ncbi:hypothetical protein [Lysinibacillus sp. G4S2]|uniref:hypothetical protein n=1 Tax=Lysinibacillus sp. G4S2 TaxID=3055859 RepID=UPI0025A119F8|nr:hypothetical protein [Lysinibacillus sp. G4S2]MDM5248110.1 hypothetical protein [Lysinibacillus sp. G4S2]
MRPRSEAQRLIGRPQEALLCAKAKRQLQMFYLRESEASATNVFCSESKASATKRPTIKEITPSCCPRAIL